MIGRSTPSFCGANGFTVTEVDSTDDGFLAAPLADLIITGIRMLGSFDGIELVRRLREDEQTKHKPVIVLTVCTLEPDQARAFAVGCNVFLPKPTEKTATCQVDRQMIESRPSTRKLRLMMEKAKGAGQGDRDGGSLALSLRADAHTACSA